MRLIVVAPIYNEQTRLPILLGDLGRASLPPGVDLFSILVDDGSNDHSPTILSGWQSADPVNHRMIELGSHRGVGHALHSGLTAARSIARDGDYITVIEGDGSSDLNLLSRMIRCLESGKDVVIASRLCAEGGSVDFPARRRIVSMAVNRLVALRWPHPAVKDYTIFFRMYRARVIRDSLKSLDRSTPRFQGFAYNAALLLELMTRGCAIAEVPHVYRYARRESGGRRPVLPNLLEVIRLLILGT